MNVQIKRLHPDAVVPRYAKPGDSGFDLVAVEEVVIAPGETKAVPTGLAFQIPDGYELQIRPRSGVTKNTKLRVQLGTVDSGYRGEVAVIVDNIAHPEYEIDHFENEPYELWTVRHNALHTIDGTGCSPQGNVLTEDTVPVGTYIIRKGGRIAQAVIAPVERATFLVVAELSESERGAGGFGHTGVSAE
ncbi:dUTP diphosphatase [Paenibacillus tuaregi]|uniref:dUTP diphosphatase n=1 Tax=Paenibacillus tuaregi TaxID=1816681 RepID=UPI0008395B66